MNKKIKIIDEILEQKRQIIEIDGMRYHSASFILSELSFYALNKEKNACKGDFEDLFLEDILSLLNSEVIELQYEINANKKDNRRILEEVADVAALLSGMVANIIDSIKKEK